MPNGRNRNPEPLYAGLMADYSYTQWRLAQMQQLETSYRALCDSTRQMVSGTATPDAA